MMIRLMQWLGPFKGKQRLGRVLFSKTIHLNEPKVISGKYGCRYSVPNLTENIGFEILINGIYEPETIAFIIERIPINGRFLDIGANIGGITIPVVSLRPDLTVTCLEAAPWIFSFLKENIEQNKLSHITLINKAIGERDGEFLPFYSPADKYGKGSLAPVFTQEAVTVETVMLDHLLNNAAGKTDLIKIDVEGFELLAFKGGATQLSRDTAPDILFEFVDWAEGASGIAQPGDAQQYLLDIGYALFVFEKGEVSKELTLPMRQGAAMILATKSKNQ